jgi:hypothetical protein
VLAMVELIGRNEAGLEGGGEIGIGHEGLLR